MSFLRTRWGIAGTGRISSDFCTALNLVAAAENQMVAVGARKLEDAETFAERHGAGKAHGSYERLAADPGVEIVYIGTVHSTHCRLTCMMLTAGKHVVCEKPLGLSAIEVKQATALAEAKGLLLVEGFWSRFFPAYDRLRTLLGSQSVGEVRFGTVAFGFPLGSERHWTRELGGGITLDLGCYGVQLAAVIFRNERPVKVTTHADRYSSGVDRSTSTTLVYSGGRMMEILSSGELQLTNTAVVYGTRGTITLPLLWAPSELHCSYSSPAAANGSFSWPIPQVTGPTNFPRIGGFAYEIAAARRAAAEGKTETEEMSHADSLLIAEIQDEILLQLGVVLRDTVISSGSESIQ